MTRVLLTGATGTFGRYLARELLARECELVVIVRGRDEDEARRRVLAAVVPKSVDAVTTVCGDLGEPELALENRASVRSCHVVLHAAASTSFGLTLEAAREANVEGTAAVLRLARSLPTLETIGYVGTAFVAGRRVGRIYEAELRHRAGFANAYERSKYEAELVARASGLPLCVFRPSVIVENETTSVPTALRACLQLIASERLTALPSPPHATLDVITARDAARAIVDLLLTRQRGHVYHVASGDSAPRVADIALAGTGRRVAFMDLPTFEDELRRLQSRSAASARVYGSLGSALKILAYPKVFDTRAAEAALGRSVAQADPLRVIGRTLEAAA